MTRRRRLLAWALILTCVPAALLISRVGVDNRLERWVGDDHRSAQLYEEFRRDFGSDEFVVVAVWGDRLFQADTLWAMIEAAEAMEAVPGVRRVRGLPLVFRDLLGGEDPEALRDEMLSTPFYQGLFVSADGTAAGFMVEVEPAADAGARRAIVDGLRKAAGPLGELGLEPMLVGSTVLITSLDEISGRESKRAFLIALAASLAALAVLLRSWRAMVAAAACAGVTVLLSLAAVVAAGRSLNMITSVLPALLWVLSLSGAVHILRRYQHHRGVGDSLAEAMDRSLAETVRPCVLAALTTALGFASLVVARMAPVRELGVFAAVGVLLSLAVNLSLPPLLVGWLRVGGRSAAESLSQRLRGLLHLGIRRPRAVAAVGFVLTVAMAAAVPFVRLASNPLGFLPASHPTVGAYARVGSGLTGFYTMEVVVDTPAPWTDPAVWPVVDGLQQVVAASPVVARVLSPLDLLRKANQWGEGFDPRAYRLPPTAQAAEALVYGLDPAGRDSLAALVAASGTRLRLSAVVNEMDEGRFLELVTATRQAIAGLPAGYSARITGQVLRLVEAQNTLVMTQLESLGLAFVVVFASIAIGLRSLRLTVLAVLPNLLPLVAAFALMAALDLPLDAATVMVASVALGIAVDDTVHLLAAIQSGADGDVGRALDRVAPAMATTTVAACIGFFALTGSAFVPIRDFGLLAGAAMLVALAADLFLAPALLVVGRQVRDRVLV